MPCSINIQDGGTLTYDATFYGKEEADNLFEQISAETQWQQERGRTGPFPRLTAWYADAGLTYSYSGVRHEALPWTPRLTEIRLRVQDAASASFNSLLLNLYRDGQDSIGFHSDAEPELGVNPVIASISLGAVRQFMLKHIKTGKKLKYDLAHGSLLVMGGTCQHHWVHGVPKIKTTVGARINLTFRRIIRISG
jgi:alkylated DNA repair dioxygenase AlkB